jgi:hypothetical protein
MQMGGWYCRDLKEIVMEGAGWNSLAQDSNQWQGPVNTLMKLRVASEVRNFLSNLATHCFSGTYYQAAEEGYLRRVICRKEREWSLGKNNTQIYFHIDLIAP